MIIVKLMGGLGNQMFQYALGRRLAIENNAELKLDISGYAQQEGVTPRLYALDIFLISAGFASQEEIERLKYPNKLFARLDIPGKHCIKERNSNMADARILAAGDGCYLEGYWQAEGYSRDIRSVLLKEFSLRPEYATLDSGLLAEMANGRSVALHVRRGDYVANVATNLFHGTCSPEYYQRAIAYIAEYVPDPTFFVFSDDIAWVKENILIDFPTIYVSDGKKKDYEELILMSRCKHAIVANSSFSWWGAWLNQDPEKIVIAPEYWLKDVSVKTIDLLPPEWVVL